MTPFEEFRQLYSPIKGTKPAMQMNFRGIDDFQTRVDIAPGHCLAFSWVESSGQLCIPFFFCDWYKLRSASRVVPGLNFYFPSFAFSHQIRISWLVVYVFEGMEYERTRVQGFRAGNPVGCQLHTEAYSFAPYTQT